MLRIFVLFCLLMGLAWPVGFTNAEESSKTYLSYYSHFGEIILGWKSDLPIPGKLTFTEVSAFTKTVEEGLALASAQADSAIIDQDIDGALVSANVFGAATGEKALAASNAFALSTFVLKNESNQVTRANFHWLANYLLEGGITDLIRDRTRASLNVVLQYKRLVPGKGNGINVFGALESEFLPPKLSSAEPKFSFSTGYSTEAAEEFSLTFSPNGAYLFQLSVELQSVAAVGFEGCGADYWRNYNRKKHTSTWYSYYPEESFSAVFGIGPGMTLLEALKLKGGREKALFREAVAALLNAAHPEVDYFFSTSDVIEIVKNAYDGGNLESVADELSFHNKLGALYVCDDLSDYEPWLSDTIEIVPVDLPLEGNGETTEGKQEGKKNKE